MVTLVPFYIESNFMSIYRYVLFSHLTEIQYCDTITSDIYQHYSLEADMRDVVADITCPKCSRILKVKLGLMVPGRSQRCICGCKIRFSGDDGSRIQRELDALARRLRRLGR